MWFYSKIGSDVKVTTKLGTVFTIKINSKDRAKVHFTNQLERGFKYDNHE